MFKKFAIAGVAAVLLAGPSSAANAELSKQDITNLLTERAIAHDVSPAMMLCVVNKESRFDPSARGSLGERGLAQWLPGRKQAWDYTVAYSQGIDIIKEYQRGNPDAVYFDADGLADLLSRGRAYRHKHWPVTIQGCE